MKRRPSALCGAWAATLLACGGADASPDAASGLASITPCTGSLSAALEQISSAGPGAGSDGYAAAADEQREAWQRSLDAVIDGRGADATANATSAGYTLCRSSADGDDLVRWLPSDSSGRAAIALRLNGACPLIVGAPHPRFESSTLAEAVLLFDTLNARALVVSGTHRCANSAASSCDGTTGVCGGSGRAYRESDMAHVTGSIFHLAHLELRARYPELWAISLHGMGDDGASISDGTTAPTNADAPVAVFAAALSAELPGERITTCNDYPGAVAQRRLCGTTNAQGRAWNASADACGTAASVASGRFLHLEQSSTVRGQPDAVARALSATVAPWCSLQNHRR